MMTTALLGALVAAVGIAAALVALTQRRVAAGGDAAAWLAADMAERPSIVTSSASFADRIVWPAITRLGRLVAAQTPSARLDALHQKLLHAGLSAKIRAEELLAIYLLAGVGSVLVAAAWVTLVGPPARLAVLGTIVLLVVGWCGPRVVVERRAAERKLAIFKDLPDALDLMTIAMEAGVGFDGAIQVVAEHLEGPLAEELSRSLNEMELGRSRHEALQNLKRRADVPELSSVVVALLQADSLGMPVSRVLRVQAGEMRAKRRQWAREKAGKLPVKILFPLIVFIFPPVMVIIVGPAVGDIARLFG